VLGGIRTPLSACTTTLAFDNQPSLLCTEAGTDGWPRLRGVRVAAFLSALLDRGNSGDNDDEETRGDDDDGLAKVKAVG
jgi:hypothetical protein